jgi:hypothetical protein
MYLDEVLQRRMQRVQQERSRTVDYTSDVEPDANLDDSLVIDKLVPVKREKKRRRRQEHDDDEV